eukprot:gene9184-10143_t
MLSARYGPFIASSGSTLALITMTSLSVFTARACRYLSSHPVLSQWVSQVQEKIMIKDQNWSCPWYSSSFFPFEWSDLLVIFIFTVFGVNMWMEVLNTPTPNTAVTTPSTTPTPAVATTSPIQSLPSVGNDVNGMEAIGLDTLKTVTVVVTRQQQQQQLQQSDSPQQSKSTITTKGWWWKENAHLSLILRCFSMIFLAELGDRSFFSIFTLSVSKEVGSIYIGTILGQIVCIALAIVFGEILTKYLSERMVSMSGGTIFILYAFYQIIQAYLK